MSGAGPALAFLAAAALHGLAGCGGDDDTVALRLVVPDNSIRVEGVECSGAQPFRYVHAGAPFTVEDGAGAVLVEGELPPGEAVNADPSVDWGVERIPTFCVMELEIDDLPERPAYRLRLAEGRPLEFDASLLAGDQPVPLVVE